MVRESAATTVAGRRPAAMPQKAQPSSSGLAICHDARERRLHECGPLLERVVRAKQTHWWTLIAHHAIRAKDAHGPRVGAEPGGEIRCHERPACWHRLRTLARRQKCETGQHNPFHVSLDVRSAGRPGISVQSDYHIVRGQREAQVLEV